MIENDIEVKYNTRYLPLDYKILEWRLAINRELYEEKIIDLKVYSLMENQLLGRMKKIKNDIRDRMDDDLTTNKIHGSMSSS